MTATEQRLRIIAEEATSQAERNARLAKAIREDMNRERDEWINRKGKQ